MSERFDRNLCFALVTGLVVFYGIEILTHAPAHTVALSPSFLVYAFTSIAMPVAAAGIILQVMPYRHDRKRLAFLTLSMCALFFATLPQALILLDTIRGSVIFDSTCLSPERRDYYLFILSNVAKGATLFGLLDVYDLDLSPCRTPPASFGRHVGYAISVFFSSVVLKLLAIAFRRFWSLNLRTTASAR